VKEYNGTLNLLCELDLRTEINVRRPLLASAGSEFDLDLTISAAERLKISRANMKKTLGLDELAIAEMDALGRELVNDEDLSTSSSTAAAFSSTPTCPVNMEQLSARERQALKRKSRLSNQVVTKKQCKNTITSAPATSTTVTQATSFSLEAYLDAIDNDVQWFCERMKESLLSPNWQTRHGAILALRATLQLGLPSKVSEDGGLIGWLELLLADLLLVLGLDRFGDFVGDQVVSPVKETAAQLFAIIFRHVSSVEAFKVIIIQRHLQTLLGFDLWQVRHGGLLALKYVLASSTVEVASEVIKSVGEMVCGLLQDSDEDVRAVSADVLSLLIGEKGCPSAAASLLDKMVESLAFVLIDLDSSASLNIASVFELLAQVLTLNVSSAQDLINLTPEALLPFVRHASVKVRLQVVHVYEALPLETITVSVFRQFMQSLALEMDRFVADATLSFCQVIAARIADRLLSDDKVFLSRLLKITATTLGVPYNPALFTFPGDRTPEHELSFKKSDMMLISESDAARQRLYVAKVLSLLPKTMFSEEKVLKEWAESDSCLNHMLLHWIKRDKVAPPMPAVFTEELGLFTTLSLAIGADRPKSAKEALDLALTAELDAHKDVILSLQVLHSRLEARFRAAYCQPDEVDAPDVLLTAIIEDDNPTLQEQFASELVVSLQNPSLPVETMSLALQRLAKMLSLLQLCPKDEEHSEEVFAYSCASWTEYALSNSTTWRGAQLVLCKMVEKEGLLEKLLTWIGENFDPTWMIDLLVGLLKNLNGRPCPRTAVRWYDLLEDSIFKSREPWHGAAALALLLSNDSSEMLEIVLTRGISRPEPIPVLCLALELLLRAETSVIPTIPILLKRVLQMVNDQDGTVRKHATLAFSQLMKLAPLETESCAKNAALSPAMLKAISESRDFLDHLQGPPASLPDFVPPCPINIALRPYQQAGLNWLAFLKRYSLHGALCDDMGLGKTLQTLCIIASDHYERKGSNGLRSLIVCPASLAGHWEAEMKQYCPTLPAPLLYIGSAAERRTHHLAKLEGAEVVVTSYDVLRADGECFAALSWNYCVLDEGHLIKNPKTKLAMCVRQLRVQHRLILSGTPIQNNLLELWSLFDYLMPGYLGTEREFAEKYSKPIAILQQQQQQQQQQQHQQQQQQWASAANASKWTQRDFDDAEHRMQLLHKQVLPFILRRMKEDVLKDLPPKIIQDYTCSMSSVQRIVYDDLLRSSALRQEISTYLQSRLKADSSVEAKGGCTDKAAGSSMHVFQALQYLRKLCIHPSLVLTPGHPLEGEVRDELQRQNWSLASDLEVAPKFSMLKELLIECGLGGAEDSGMSEDLVSGNRHRVLIFAQQKHTLDLVEKLVFKGHLPHLTYLRLDGGVEAAARYPIVSKFNSDPTIDVLLLTTHVGGLGLNLTAADTVIFMDPDWNPSRDLQAMDRAHRLGQKRVVTVYRLLLKDSLEERIMGMQRWKILLASSIVTQQNSSINSEGLLDLFEERNAGKSNNGNGNGGGGGGKEESASEKWLKSHQGLVIAGGADADHETEYSAEFDIKVFQDRRETKEK